MRLFSGHFHFASSYSLLLKSFSVFNQRITSDFHCCDNWKNKTACTQQLVRKTLEAILRGVNGPADICFCNARMSVKMQQKIMKSAKIVRNDFHLKPRFLGFEDMALIGNSPKSWDTKIAEKNVKTNPLIFL